MSRMRDLDNSQRNENFSTGNTRRRRLECANEHRFTTLETIVVRKTPIRQKQKTPKAGGGA
jgi:transcriptional regulator NrdR family protein